MNRKGTATLPKPFGDEVPQEDWRRLFLLTRKNSPLLNLYNGTRDLGRELVSFMASSGSIELVVQDFPPTFATPGSNSLLLVRGQYFEAGLHHRISFHATVRARIEIEDQPACLLAILPPIRRVTNLYVAYPSDDKPLFLEIPIAGAPPDVRVVEFNMGSLKVYTPEASRLLPETKFIRDMRLQFVDLGTALVSGKVHQTGENEIEIDLEPLKSHSHELVSAYLESRFTEEFPPSTNTLKNEDPENSADSPPPVDHLVSQPDSSETVVQHAGRALVIIQSEEERSRIEAILKGLGWDVDTKELFTEIQNLKSYGNHQLIVLDSSQGELHAIDLLRDAIRDEFFTAINFVIFGEKSYEAHMPDWSGLGRGLFLRKNLPDKWLRSKLERWFNEPARPASIHDYERIPMILIVDDDTDLRNSLGDVLIDQKFRVITASNGDEGIRSIRNLHPDLVLLDLEMPGHSGLEVLATIRSFKAFRHLPVIIVSGRRDHQALNQALAMGITDYIVKPFDNFKLIQRIRAALQG